MVFKKIFFTLLFINIGLMPLYGETKKNKKLISFNFEDEELANIVNYLAAEKGINIILPPAPNKLTTKVTLKHQKKLTVQNAFRRLNTLLEMSGYTMRPHGNTYIISKAAGTTRDALPVYIGVSPQDLPDTDAPIRFLYYFDNIKIPAGATGQAQDIKTILEDILQDPAKPGTTQIIFDSTTNCVVITAKAYSIKSAMQIIEELDKTGFREMIEIVPLTNTSASFVGKFLNEQLLAAAQEPSPLAPPNTDTGYFSKTTKVIPDQRSNSLIILGRSQTVNKLKDFVYEYIDVPLESGDSLVHVYELQYLDAQKFAEDLRAIIKPAEVSGQAKGSVAEEQAFKGVIIEAEKPGEVGKLETQAGTVGTTVQGGNRLIIAAKKKDWQALKQLIESLDKPQPQIALEILVADISLRDAKKLGSQLRNKGDALPKNVDFQFAGLGSPVVFDETLQQNLLRPGDQGFNLANTPPTERNSFILSFNDPATNGIWWVLDMLKNFESSKILSHPHIITLNQVQAKVSIAENRLAEGPVNRNPDGSVSRLIVNLDASISVEILPRINLSNSINLQIAIKVNNFVSPDSNARNTRTVITNATVGNGEVLVLGGLVKTSEADTSLGVPVLSKIPLVGWFFKSRSKSVAKDDLMVFISPTVIKPRVGGGMSEASSSKFAYGKGVVDKSTIFENIKDPITHWFFKSPKGSSKDMVAIYEDRKVFGDKPLAGGLSEEDRKRIKPEPKRVAATKKRTKKTKVGTLNDQETQVAKNETEDAKRLKNMLAHEANPLERWTA